MRLPGRHLLSFHHVTFHPLNASWKTEPPKNKNDDVAANRKKRTIRAIIIGVLTNRGIRLGLVGAMASDLEAFAKDPASMVAVQNQPMQRTRSSVQTEVNVQGRAPQVTVHLTPAQRQVLERRAELLGVSTSSYIVCEHPPSLYQSE